MRVGLGFDLHRFAKGRKLILAGVEVPFEKGLSGNSDADIILHSIADAILGALGKGDIGDYFPDKSLDSLGLSSRKIIDEVLTLLKSSGSSIVNLDITVILDTPRLLPYKPAFKQSLSQILNLPPGKINIKVKSQEGIWQPEEFAVCMCVVGIE